MSPNKPKAQSQRSGKEIIDYIEALLRRPFHVGIPIVVIAVAALVASFVIPKQYQAKTLIIVEYEKVPLPNAFLPKAAPETTKRLLAITQEVLSRTRLEKVVRELDPYGSKDDGISDDVDLMRTASSVNIKGSDAFTIAYVHKDPATAQAVANRLASVFVEEASELRSEQMAGASDFIDSEMEQARKALDARDAEIRRFKERNMGHLPEQTSANLATLQRLQSDKQVVEESLRAAMQRQSLIEQSLGASGQDTGKELVQLRGQLAALKGRYTDEHPDVRALTGRIGRLEKETSGGKPPPRDPAMDAVPSGTTPTGALRTSRPGWSWRRGRSRSWRRSCGTIRSSRTTTWPSTTRGRMPRRRRNSRSAGRASTSASWIPRPCRRARSSRSEACSFWSAFCSVRSLGSGSRRQRRSSITPSRPRPSWSRCCPIP
jgi:capsular polysaccharide biosynthesis protein